MKAFSPGFKPPSANRTASVSAFWFIIGRGRLLVRLHRGTPGRCRILEAADLGRLGLHFRDPLYLGSMDNRPCWAGLAENADIDEDNFQWMDIRALFGVVDEALLWVAGLANQLLYWDASHRFCGRCGGKTRDKEDERAKICPECDLINYPRLSPAIIVAVLRGDRILLGRNQRFRGAFYSVLAGFVEPGEALEDCVKREVREETGIEVTNIRYFGSQPWPFPDSLMIGFIADYADGEIKADSSELISAAWFPRDDLPNIPPKISIARQLIDWFVESR